MHFSASGDYFFAAANFIEEPILRLSSTFMYVIPFCAQYRENRYTSPTTIRIYLTRLGSKRYVRTTTRTMV